MKIPRVEEYDDDLTRKRCGYCRILISLDNCTNYEGSGDLDRHHGFSSNIVEEGCEVVVERV